MICSLMRFFADKNKHNRKAVLIFINNILYYRSITFERWVFQVRNLCDGPQS